MRILIISDIHANLAAFEAVLDEADENWDKIWCLGDIIGYGPDPNECVARLREHEHLSLSGNHDWAVLEKLDISSFNQDARTAIQWARDTITDETRDYLKTLPPMLQPDETFTLAHGSPRQPVWEYILDEGTAAVNFSYFDTPYCLVGHTHSPVIFEQIDAIRVMPYAPIYDQPLQLEEARLIINTGSVGQPRDSDPRAAYAFLDTETLTWTFHRVAYDIKWTQQRMRNHKLPNRLIQRLERGW